MPEDRRAVAKRFLLPGELLFVHAPTRVRTILGSCVAITMRAAHSDLAAVVHCLLPRAGEGPLPQIEAPKYVDSAIDAMLGMFAQHGTAVHELEVKVFGGADNLNSSGGAGYGVGNANAETALDVLARRGLDPTACDVGGDRGRVLEFETSSGDVFISRLPVPSSAGRPGKEEA
jgi:chemotaxis protein CheD